MFLELLQQKPIYKPSARVTIRKIIYGTECNIDIVINIPIYLSIKRDSDIILLVVPIVRTHSN